MILCCKLQCLSKFTFLFGLTQRNTLALSTKFLGSPLSLPPLLAERQSRRTHQLIFFPLYLRNLAIQRMLKLKGGVIGRADRHSVGGRQSDFSFSNKSSDPRGQRRCKEGQTESKVAITVNGKHTIIATHFILFIQYNLLILSYFNVWCSLNTIREHIIIFIY